MKYISEAISHYYYYYYHYQLLTALSILLGKGERMTFENRFHGGEMSKGKVEIDTLC